MAFRNVDIVTPIILPQRTPRGPFGTPARVTVKTVNWYAAIGPQFGIIGNCGNKYIIAKFLPSRTTPCIDVAWCRPADNSIIGRNN